MLFISRYAIITLADVTASGCGAVGSALPWGGRGRGFKSRHSDQNSAVEKLRNFFMQKSRFSKRKAALFFIIYLFYDISKNRYRRLLQYIWEDRARFHSTRLFHYHRTLQYRKALRFTHRCSRLSAMLLQAGNNGNLSKVYRR